MKCVGLAGRVSLVIVSLFAMAAVFAPLIAPFDPLSGDLMVTNMPPFWIEGGAVAYPLGTDMLGRDIFSRLVFGARASLAVSLASIIIAGLIGTALGLVAGYFRGWVDTIIMRVVDLLLALPLVLVALVLAVTLGPSFLNVVIIFVLALWAEYARLIRAETLSLRERDFVKLARVADAGSARIMLRHILPNVTNTILVIAVLQVGRVILMEASLSFLGAGLPPPQPAWGIMVAEGRDLIGSQWWIATMPGVAIVVLIIALNLLGDWLRDMLDPKMNSMRGGI